MPDEPMDEAEEARALQESERLMLDGVRREIRAVVVRQIVQADNRAALVPHVPGVGMVGSRREGKLILGLLEVLGWMDSGE